MLVPCGTFIVSGVLLPDNNEYVQQPWIYAILYWPANRNAWQIPLWLINQGKLDSVILCIPIPYISKYDNLSYKSQTKTIIDVAQLLAYVHTRMHSLLQPS